MDKNNRPLNSKIHYNRALVYSKQGRYKEAIADCNLAFELNDKYLKAVLLRAQCHNDLEMYEECVRDYEQAQGLEKKVNVSRLLREAKLSLKKSKRKDYYKILGISTAASSEEIKKAYRKRAMDHHPDRHSHSSDEERREQEVKFKEVGEAYAILSDPTKKMRYDNGMDMEGGGGGGHEHYDPSQMFSRFFQAGPGGPSFHFN